MTTLHLRAGNGNNISRFDLTPADRIEHEKARRRKIQRRLDIEREKTLMLREELKEALSDADELWQAKRWAAGQARAKRQLLAKRIGGAA